MSTSHEVISAFVDDEAFEARELVTALGDPEGRELLIDLIALRHIVGTDHAQVSMVAGAGRTRRRLWLAGVAAALVMCASAGYMAGVRRAHADDVRRASAAPSLSDAAPAPTRIITLTPGENWHDSNGGGD